MVNAGLHAQFSSLGFQCLTCDGLVRLLKIPITVRASWPSLKNMPPEYCKGVLYQASKTATVIYHITAVHPSLYRIHLCVILNTHRCCTGILYQHLKTNTIFYLIRTPTSMQNILSGPSHIVFKKLRLRLYLGN